MRAYLSIILAGIVFVLGIPCCFADDGDVANDLDSNDAHLQIVNQTLDRIESFRNNPVVFAHPAIIPQNNELQFSSETYWARYKEPGNFSQKGFLSGYDAQIAHRISTDPKSIINMLGLQAQWANGKFKQPADQGFSGIKDRTFDMRGIVGKDFYPTSYLRTTGYLGLGYRYLKDNSQGLQANIDGFSLQGYNRFSHYVYLPLGADFVLQTDPNYSFESNLEYDYMMDGWQVSKLGVIPGYNTLVVDQKYGDGFRASVRLNLYFKYFTGFAEWFYRYWSIPQSKSKPDPTDPAYSLYEPKNNTQEMGFRFGLQI